MIRRVILVGLISTLTAGALVWTRLGMAFLDDFAAAFELDETDLPPYT